MFGCVPKGPKGQKRPADVIANAVQVMRIATGEAEDAVVPDSPAVVLGRKGGIKGGRARSAALSRQRRSEIAKTAAETRWKNRRT